MSKMSGDAFEIVLFGLQGMGNVLIETVSNHPRCRIRHVYTRAQTHSFRYYPCEPIEALCRRLGLDWSHVPEKGPWQAEKADLALVSSFHRILQPEHLAGYRHAINLHPSLLPAYGGATPTNWQLLAGELISGLSAHRLTAQVDGGDILYRLPVLNPQLNDAELRFSLAFASAGLIARICDDYPDFPLLQAAMPARIRPPRRVADAVLDLADLRDPLQLARHIKAFTNYPMPRLRLPDGRCFVIDYARPQTSLEIVLQGQGVEILGFWES